MSKINLESMKIDMFKKQEKIQNLQNRLLYLQEKTYYTLQCKGCGQYWDAVYLTSEYDRIYYWKSSYSNKFTVMNERFLALTCPECGQENPLRKSFNCRYETETPPESDRINVKTFNPNKLVKIKTIYQMTGRAFEKVNRK